MGEKEIVNQIITYIPKINWSVTPIDVSLFETTIRYLGGMVSGYDFLSGPLVNLADSKDDVDALPQLRLRDTHRHSMEQPHLLEPQ
jgi:mannosyl-oligosaccharide alpha-1,2-mannosidase